MRTWTRRIVAAGGVKDEMSRTERSGASRFAPRGFAAGLGAGLLIGAFAGLLWASEALLRNPGIQGLRDRALVLSFFPAFYGLIGAAAGLAGAVLFAVAPRVMRNRYDGRPAPFATGAAAGLFALLEGLGRCYECHQWYRKIIPSMTIGVTESFLRFLTVIGVALLFGALFGLAVLAVVRAAEATPARSRRARLALVLLFVAVIAIGVSRGAPSYHAPAYDPSLVRDGVPHVRLLVMDGADWDYIRPVLDAGRMPVLESLIDRGASGDLGISFPTVSPYMWTNLTTGLDDDESGLCDFFAYRVPGAEGIITRYPGIGNSKRFVFQKFVPRLSNRGIGKAVFASSSQKRAPELWDYLGAAGEEVCVVGWRYSWPARMVRGAMITERFGAHDLRWPMCYPEDLKDRLRRDFTADAEPLVRRIIGDKYADAKPKELGVLKVRIDKIRYQLERDLKFTALGRELIDEIQPRFAAVGLTTVDAIEHGYIVEHVLGKEKRTALNDYLRRFSTAEAVTRLSSTIEDCHAVWDSLIGVVTADVGPDDVVIVVSDHGHDLDGSGHRFGPPGIIVMAGGPVKPDARFDGAKVYDITPTVLHLCGLPVPEGMKGRVLTEVLDGAWLADHPVRYLRAGAGAGGELLRPEELPELDATELENLKALGYVD